VFGLQNERGGGWAIVGNSTGLVHAVCVFTLARLPAPIVVYENTNGSLHGVTVGQPRFTGLSTEDFSERAMDLGPAQLVAATELQMRRSAMLYRHRAGVNDMHRILLPAGFDVHIAESSLTVSIRDTVVAMVLQSLITAYTEHFFGVHMRNSAVLECMWDSSSASAQASPLSADSLTCAVVLNSTMCVYTTENYDMTGAWLVRLSMHRWGMGATSTFTSMRYNMEPNEQADSAAVDPGDITISTIMELDYDCMSGPSARCDSMNMSAADTASSSHSHFLASLSSFLAESSTPGHVDRVDTVTKQIVILFRSIAGVGERRNARLANMYFDGELACPRGGVSLDRHRVVKSRAMVIEVDCQTCGINEYYNEFAPLSRTPALSQRLYVLLNQGTGGLMFTTSTDEREGLDGEHRVSAFVCEVGTALEIQLGASSMSFERVLIPVPLPGSADTPPVEYNVSADGLTLFLVVPGDTTYPPTDDAHSSVRARYAASGPVHVVVSVDEVEHILALLPIRAAWEHQCRLCPDNTYSSHYAQVGLAACKALPGARRLRGAHAAGTIPPASGDAVFSSIAGFDLQELVYHPPSIQAAFNETGPPSASDVGGYDEWGSVQVFLQGSLEAVESQAGQIPHEILEFLGMSRRFSATISNVSLVHSGYDAHIAPVWISNTTYTQFTHAAMVSATVRVKRTPSVHTFVVQMPGRCEFYETNYTMANKPLLTYLDTTTELELGDRIDIIALLDDIPLRLLNPSVLYRVAQAGTRTAWSPVNVPVPLAIHGVLQCASPQATREAPARCAGLVECSTHVLGALFS